MTLIRWGGKWVHHCTPHKPILCAIRAPQIIKVDRYLAKFWQKQLCTVFLTRWCKTSHPGQLSLYPVSILLSVAAKSTSKNCDLNRHTARYILATNPWSRSVSWCLAEGDQRRPMDLVAQEGLSVLRIKRGFHPTQRTHRTQRNERKQRKKRKKGNERNSRKKRKLQPIGTELYSFQLNSSLLGLKN